MFLVVGSTGILGSEIVHQLRAADKSVRALVRKTSDPEKVARLKSLGATLVEGDLTDKASLLAACQGITTVITTATTTASQTPGDSIPRVDQLGTLQLVEAAMASGVSHFIYLSMRTNIPDCALNTAKRTVEDRIRGGCMAYTILRPSFFMEVWLSPFLGFDYPNAQARIYGSGENKVSYISGFNVADYGVAAVERDTGTHAVLEMGGPEAISQLDAVRTFERVLGVSCRLEFVPVEAVRARYDSGDPLQKTLGALMLGCDRGDVIPGALDLAKEYGVTLRSVADYAATMRRHSAGE